MNQMPAVITHIETEEHISLVTVKAAGFSFTILVIDTPATAPYLQAGNSVTMMYKETALSIGKNAGSKWSIDNQFPATVAQVVGGRVLTSVLLHANGVALKAVITTQAASSLALAPGDAVSVHLRANDISLLRNE